MSENEKDKKISVQTIVLVGVFTAVTAVLSALPMPFNILGVPATLQTFAMSFIGFLLGWKLGMAVAGIYLILGLIGVPVYNGFVAGATVLFGPTGGYIWGFIIMAGLCGLTLKFKNYAVKVVLTVASIGICEVLGVIQFSIYMKMAFTDAFKILMIYIPKDAVFVVIGFVVSIAVRKALIAAKLMPKAAL